MMIYDRLQTFIWSPVMTIVPPSTGRAVMFDTTPPTYVNSKSPVAASPNVAGVAEASHVNVTFPAVAEIAKPNTVQNAPNEADNNVFMASVSLVVRRNNPADVLIIPKFRFTFRQNFTVKSSKLHRSRHKWWNSPPGKMT